MDDLQYMQRQAARRVQQMQEHSRQVVEQHQQQENSYEAQQTRRWPGDTPTRLASPGLYLRPESTPSEPEVIPSPPEVTASAPDTEQWFLLGLAMLLLHCECRPELLLAILYLAL